MRGLRTGEVKDEVFLLGQVKVEKAFTKRLRVIKYKNNDLARSVRTDENAGY